MSNSLTDSQKIEQLWGRLNRAHQEKASMQLLIDTAEAQVAARDTVIKQQKETIESLQKEIQRLGLEVNAARVAAATSVQEYIAEQR